MTYSPIPRRPPRALLAVVAMTVTSTAFSAPRSAMDWTQGYEGHPLVRQARRDGHLNASLRRALLTTSVPLDRALAICSAMSTQQARAFHVTQRLLETVQANRGEKAKDPLTVAELSARQALLIGWSWSREGSSRQPSWLKRWSSPQALLEHAANAGADEQTTRLALAVHRATTYEGSSRTRQCELWLQVHKDAREPGKRSVALPQAEAAVAAVRHLERRCSPSQRALGRRPLQLPPPPPEGPATTDASDASRRAAQDTHPAAGAAFGVTAPVFKGYMDRPEIRALLRARAMSVEWLAALLLSDELGDVTVAALNAAVLTRKVRISRVVSVTLKAIQTHHGGRVPPVDRLSAVEATALAYAKAVAGQGLRPRVSTPDASAATALPTRLFQHAKSRWRPSAQLVRMMRLVHLLDLQFVMTRCDIAARADATLFVLRKSRLPSATKTLLEQAISAMSRSCSRPEP